MSYRGKTFASDRSLATIERIRACVQQSGEISTTEITRELGACNSNISAYLRHMEAEGIVRRTQIARNDPRGGSSPTLWAIDTGPAPIIARRDYLVAALFGEPMRVAA